MTMHIRTRTDMSRFLRQRREGCFLYYAGFIIEE